MMGRLAGFKYREIVDKLRALGWSFDRHAAGSHEIWRHAAEIDVDEFLKE